MKRGGSPSVVVWVVGIAHSIEVELLEQGDVSQHRVFSHSFAPPVLVHVAVHPLDHDGLVVVQQLPPPDLILPKPHLCHTMQLELCCQEAACLLVLFYHQALYLESMAATRHLPVTLFWRLGCRVVDRCADSSELHAEGKKHAPGYCLSCLLTTYFTVQVRSCCIRCRLPLPPAENKKVHPARHDSVSLAIYLSICRHHG